MSQYENSTTVAEQRQRILRLEVRNSAEEIERAYARIQKARKAK